MAHIIDRLSTLRVSHVMSKDVVAVSEALPMGDVARVLQGHEVSSVPVVDDRGHCIGVITATDFVKRDVDLRQRQEGAVTAGEPRLLEPESDQPYHIDSTAEDFAGAHMSPAVQSIHPDASLLKASRMMCAQHIHRLFVIDDTSHPVGVISTMDIVAALVNVVDEMEEDVSRRRE